MDDEHIIRKILDCSFKVHKTLGPGLLESAYEECLNYELVKSGLRIERQKGLPIVYEEIHIGVGYRLDLLVESRIIVEIKAVECLLDVHYAQIITYLKLSNLKLGLLINFNTKLLKNGIHRIIN
ncbi:MAG: GxxExxY protein [Bacteroidetes bacterium]|nr:GxxExxY protein [Bacteroidota bacterium]